MIRRVDGLLREVGDGIGIALVGKASVHPRLVGKVENIKAGDADVCTWITLPHLFNF